MGIAVLGPLELDGAPTVLGPRDRVVLQVLAVTPGLPVRADTLAEALWGEEAPPSWAKVVQGCIVRLRKALGADAIETTPHGYRLVHHADHIDHLRFGRLLERARELVAASEPERAAYVLREALALWRGEPFAELLEWAPGRAATERLVELRLEADELLVEAQLLAGHHREALGPAQHLVHEAPLRERRWGLLALALYQDSRQAEALDSLHQARTVLLEELGLDPGPALVALEQAILNQDPALAVSAAIPEPSVECPYLGLVAYGIKDAAAFFGREEVTDACLRRLDQWDVLAVVGPSGSGKSSLVRAGVAAALERDGLRLHVVTPGRRPMASLAGVPSRPGSILVVDQCEEALALDEASPERAEFFDALVKYAESHQLVLTLRADRIGELSAHEEFARLVEQGLYLLGPMSQPELRRAIEGPAAQAGLRLEPGLVDLLVREVSGEPAALPLLSHVLRQTWRRREGNTLTVQGYTATGGVREAVAHSAEAVFRTLDVEQQAMLRELMLRLVALDEGGDPVRTRVPRRSVVADPAHARLVEQLLGARLLASGDDTLEIAHESLAVAWPRLRSWLDEDVDGLRIMRHLAVSAESWRELGRPDSELYRGLRQAQAAEWQSRAGVSLTEVERDFLAASGDLADKEHRTAQEQVRRERQLNRRLRLGLAAVAALLAVALAAGVVAVTAAQRADREAAIAAAHARAADARRLGAEALRSEDLDRSLLLAAAGIGLDNSVETRNTLLETLGRGSALAASHRRPGLVLGLAVNPRTGLVATSVTNGDVEFLDGTTLRRSSQPGRPTRAVAVVANPDGTGFAAVGWQNLVQEGQDPAVILLDGDGTRSARQLGGIPQGYHTFQELGFSPDGRWLAASLRPFDLGNGPERTAVWDLRAPGRPVAVLPQEGAGSPVVSPDGRLLYTRSGDAVLVTELPSGAVRRVVTARDLAVRRLGDVMVASPDGRELALAAGDETVVVDRLTMKPLAYLSGTGMATGLAFSPDGTRLSASGDRLLVWDISGQQSRELLVQDSPTDYPRFSPQGDTVYTAHAGLFEAWDLSGHRRFVRDRSGADLDWDGNVMTRWTPDLSRVAYGLYTTGFRVRDVATGRLGPQVDLHMEVRNTFDLAWHPGGRILNVTSGDPVVRTWDSVTGKELARHRLGAPGPPGTTEGADFGWFTSDGKTLFVGTTTGRLHVLDAHTLAPLRDPIQVYERKEGKPREIVGLMPASDGRTVYLSDRVVDVVAGVARPYPRLGVEFDEVFPSPDGSRMFVDAREAGTGVLDLASMRWLSPPNPAQARMVGWQGAWTRDGSRFASTGDDGHTNVWDGRTGALMASIPMDTGGEPAFSRDGSQLLVASPDGSVLDWDLDPGSWVGTACRLAGRDLTEQEWRTYLPNRPFQRICQA